jgi:hypothetical protein
MMLDVGLWAIERLKIAILMQFGNWSMKQKIHLSIIIHYPVTS